MDNNEPDPSQWTAAIAKELTLAIVEADTTHMRVSEDTGIKYQSLGRYLRGERDLSQSNFIAICRSIPIEPAVIWRKTYERLGIIPDTTAKGTDQQ